MSNFFSVNCPALDTLKTQRKAIKQMYQQIKKTGLFDVDDMAKLSSVIDVISSESNALDEATDGYELDTQPAIANISLMKTRAALCAVRDAALHCSLDYSDYEARTLVALHFLKHSIKQLNKTIEVIALEMQTDATIAALEQQLAGEK